MRVLYIKLLRGLLIVLIAIVSVAVLVNYFQTNRRRGSAVKPVAQILGPESLRSIENIERMATEDGVNKYRVRAKKVLETRQGTELLEGIEANDFNADGSERNHISSQKAEYDIQRKKVFFFGDVRLRLGKDIELRTESIHYDLNTQTGYSEDPVRLESPQAAGTAKGIRYDDAHRNIELLRDLSFTVHRPVRGPDGSVKNEDYQVKARSGSYSESELLVTLKGAARLSSASASLAGENIVARFSADKRHITDLNCQGDATYESTDATETRALRGQRIDFGIDSVSAALDRIHVQGGGNFALKSAAGDQVLNGSDILLQLDPVQGKPRLMHSEQGVRFEMSREGQKTEVTGDWLEAAFAQAGGALQSMHVRGHAGMKIGTRDGAPDALKADDIRTSFRDLAGRSVPRELQAQGAVHWQSAGQSGGASHPAEPGRALTASALTMVYSETGDSLASGTATGSVNLAVLPDPAVKSPQIQTLSCDKVTFDFYPGANRIRDLAGDGHVQIVYHKPAESASQGRAEDSRTSSSSIRARFREDDGSAESVTQSGAFVYQDGTYTAKAETCDFTASTGKMILTGHPSMNGPDSSTTGRVIDYDRQQKVLAVLGSVRSVLRSSGAGNEGLLTASSGASSPSIVTADAMHYQTEQSRARYDGNVHLLSAASQLRSNSLVILNNGENIESEGEVTHIILGSGNQSPRASGRESRSPASKPAERSLNPDQVAIHCRRLTYARSTNTIHYEGSVYLESTDTKLWADTMDALLDAAGKNIEHAKAVGSLRITQPGREAKGNEGEYFPDQGKFVVTGNLAELRDSAKGTTLARRLTFFTSGDRILFENR